MRNPSQATLEGYEHLLIADDDEYCVVTRLALTVRKRYWEEVVVVNCRRQCQPLVLHKLPGMSFYMQGCYTRQACTFTIRACILLALLNHLLIHLTACPVDDQS